MFHAQYFEALPEHAGCSHTLFLLMCPINKSHKDLNQVTMEVTALGL
jgi:hypothetical protein